MDSTKWISKKIALLGSHAVGKTSMISQFVFQRFPESYLTTIGLKVDKKTVETGGYRVDLVIWDIAGQENFANIPHYYLNGCSGVIYVADLSRPTTYKDIRSQLVLLKGMVPDTEIIIAANKKDLLSPEELTQALEDFPVKADITTSAKDGENVEEAFLLLTQKLITKHES